MKKIVRWAIIILILSGWIAFGILYGVTAQEKAKDKTRITELESELASYQFLFKDVVASQEKIDQVIVTLQTLKGNLERIKDKIDKEKNDKNQKPLQ